MASGRVSTNNFALPDYIVDSAGLQFGASHTTIAAALTDASSGETIGIRANGSFYDEDITLKAGVNLVGLNAQGFSSVQAAIHGKITLGTASDCSVSNLRLITDADYAIEDTGTTSGSIRFIECTMTVDSTGGINLNNANRTLTFNNCQIDRATASVKMYNVTTCVALTFEYCVFSSASFIAVADTIAAGILGIRYCTFNRHAIALSGSATLNLFDSTINSSTDNLTGLDCSNTSGTCFIHGLSIRSGTAAGLNIGASSTVVATDLRVQTSNTNAVSGSGTFQCSGVECSGTGIAVSGSLTWSVGDLTLRNASGGGAWTLISTATASASATIDFTGLSSTYFAYKVIIDGILPATDDTKLYFRTSSNNGSSYDSGSGNYAWNALFSSSTSDTEIELFESGQGNVSDENACLELTLFNPAGTDYTKIVAVGYYLNATKVPVNVNTNGLRWSLADVDAIRFLYASGNIATGTFKLYGLAAS